MPSMAAETGKIGSAVQVETVPFVSTQAHYDLLVSEGNDPVLDPPDLAAYMDGWDGDAFLDALCLESSSRVLEIGDRKSVV